MKFSVLFFYFKLLILCCFRINNLSTRYRENLELVLKDVTINIKPGEKVNKN